MAGAGELPREAGGGGVEGAGAGGGRGGEAGAGMRLSAEGLPTWAEAMSVMAEAAADPGAEDWGMLAALSEMPQMPGWMGAAGLDAPNGLSAALPVDLADIADLVSVLAALELPEGAPDAGAQMTFHLGVQDEPLQLDFSSPGEAFAALSERLQVPEVFGALEGAGETTAGDGSGSLFLPMPGLALPAEGAEQFFSEGAPGASFLRNAAETMEALVGDFGGNGLMRDRGQQLSAMETFVHEAEGLLEDSMARSEAALAAAASPDVQELLREEDTYHTLYFGDIEAAPARPIVVEETIVVEQPLEPTGSAGSGPELPVPSDGVRQGQTEDFPISIVQVEALGRLPRDPSTVGRSGDMGGALPGLRTHEALLLGGGVGILVVAVALLARARRRRQYRLVKNLDGAFAEWSPDSKPSLGVPVSRGPLPAAEP